MNTNTTGSTTTTRSTRFNAIAENRVLGKISVPQAMVDEMGWDLIEKKVLASFELMVAYQADQAMAWALAVNNVYAAWEGAQSIKRAAWDDPGAGLGSVAAPEPLREAYRQALKDGDLRRALELRNRLRQA